jgi:hypothetical protein
MKKQFGEASELDGYDDLIPEDQAKVIKAWQDGQVADEDVPDSARKPADEDGAEKPKKAKRAPAKKKADEDDGEVAEKPKKGKAAAKVRSSLFKWFRLFYINDDIYLQKAVKESDDEIAEQDDDDEDGEEEEKPKKKRAPPKKKAEPKEKAAPKKRASKKKKEVSFTFSSSSFLYCAIPTPFI